MANLLYYVVDNIKCVRGDTFRHQWRFFEDEAQTIPADMSDIVFNGEVRDGVSDTDPLILSFDDANFTLSGTGNNVVTLLIAKEVMDVDAGKYNYDIEIVDPDGNKTTILKGKFDIFQDITTQ